MRREDERFPWLPDDSPSKSDSLGGGVEGDMEREIRCWCLRPDAGADDMDGAVIDSGGRVAAAGGPGSVKRRPGEYSSSSSSSWVCWTDFPDAGLEGIPNRDGDVKEETKGLFSLLPLLGVLNPLTLEAGIPIPSRLGLLILRING